MEKQPSSPESLHKLERQPSIEEPKTLFPPDLKAARKAALEVMRKHTKEEALKIFLKGLEPVKNAVKPDWELDNLDEDGEQDGEQEI